MNPEELRAYLAQVRAEVRAQGGSEQDAESVAQELAIRYGPKQGVKSPREVAAINRAELAKSRERTPGEELANAFVNALDAGTFGGAGLAADAITAIGPESFRTQRDARKAERDRMSTYDRVLSGIGGAVASPLNLLSGGGALLGQAPAGATGLRLAGQGLMEGAAQGAAQVVGENLGTTEGPKLGEIAAAAGTGGLLGAAIAPAAARLAQVGPAGFFDPLHRFVPDRLGGKTMREARIHELASRRAAANVREGTQLDAAAGYQVPVVPSGEGMPAPMALDVLGPNMVSRVRGATGTVQGREALRAPLEARAAQARTAIAGDAPDAPAIQQGLEDARNAQAGYEEVWEQTKGQPILTPWLEKFINTTDIGKKAWNSALQSRQTTVLTNPSRALPTVPRWNGADLVDSPVPDAEAVHLMKRYLSSLAGNEDMAAAEGFTADAAKNALDSFQNIRKDLPPIVREADARYEAASSLINAVRTGRTPWKPNPANPKADISNVLRDLEALPPVAGPASPRGMTALGKQFDVASRIREGGEGTIPRMAEQLRNPQSALSREMAVAGGPMSERLMRWADVLGRQGDVLPSGVVPTEPEAGGLLGRLAQVAGPSAKLMAARAGREAVGRQSARALAARARSDEILSRLATDTPERFQQYLRRLREFDLKAQKASARASGTAGRVGGLLVP